jgi:hypothetical protein
MNTSFVKCEVDDKDDKGDGSVWHAPKRHKCAWELLLYRKHPLVPSQTEPSPLSSLSSTAVLLRHRGTG